MIATVKNSASQEELNHLIEWLKTKDIKVDISKGTSETIIGLIGDTTKLDPYLLESMEIVNKVTRVTESFKLANRKFHPKDTIIDCGHGVMLGGENFNVIA